jgi:hypothetical protein
LSVLDKEQIFIAILQRLRTLIVFPSVGNFLVIKQTAIVWLPNLSISEWMSISKWMLISELPISIQNLILEARNYSSLCDTLSIVVPKTSISRCSPQKFLLKNSTTFKMLLSIFSFHTYRWLIWSFSIIVHFRNWNPKFRAANL